MSSVQARILHWLRGLWPHEVADLETFAWLVEVRGISDITLSLQCRCSQPGLPELVWDCLPLSYHLKVEGADKTGRRYFCELPGSAEVSSATDQPTVSQRPSRACLSLRNQAVELAYELSALCPNANSIRVLDFEGKVVDAIYR